MFGAYNEARMHIVQVSTKNSHWLSDSTKVTMVRRDYSRETAKLSGDHLDWIIYRSSMQRNDRINHLKSVYKRIETEKDFSNLFTTTRNLLGLKKAGPPNTFLVAGKYSTKHCDIAEHQAKYYIDKVQYIKESLPRVNSDPYKYIRKAFSRWIPPGGKPKFVIKAVTNSEVINIIRCLNNSHAYGHDDLDTLKIKLAAPVISQLVPGDSQIPTEMEDFLSPPAPQIL